MDTVHKNQLPNPKMASFNTIKAAIKDPLATAKMHFFIAVARTFYPYLKKYRPMMPFIGKDLVEIKVIIYCMWLVFLVAMGFSSYLFVYFIILIFFYVCVICDTIYPR